MAVRIKLRRDVNADWIADNPILAEGEIGIVTNAASDDVKMKIGDGTTAWNALSFFDPGNAGAVWGSITGTLSSQSDLQAALNLKAVDSAVVHIAGTETITGAKTFSSDIVIPDEVYGIGWNGTLEPPTKNAVYDKIEAVVASIPSAYDDTPVFYKDGSRAATGDWDLDNNDIDNVKHLSIPTGTGRINAGVYGTISETIGGLAYITGNALGADPAAPNIIVKTANDVGNFIRMRYDKGISLHTNLVGAIGTQFSDDDNEVIAFGLDGSIAFSNLTASTVPYLDADKKLVSSVVTPTELGYASGVTSAIQTQLDARARIVYSSAVAIPHTGSTGESAALVTVPIPALGINSSIRVYILSSFTANANAKTLRVKLGATAFSAIAAANTNNNCKQFTISNRGATNSQVCVNSTNTSGFGTSGSTPVTTGAIDTSVSTNLTVTIDLSNAGDTGTIESLIVEILN